MTAILHRTINADLPRIVGGQGLWLQDATGRQYLDAVSGGAGVSCIGHGNSRVSDAIARQLSKIAYAHSSFFTSSPAEELAELLLRDAPVGSKRIVFCSGGSEATDTALKLVRQTWVERGAPGKSTIIARRQSYHGATIGALSVSGNVARRETYAPMLFEPCFIGPCFPYRYQASDETVADYALRAAQELEEAILRLGPDNVAAFIAEPVVGATLGCVPAEAGYFRRVREICDRYDVLLVLDEVMCGGGRTGHYFACLEDGVVPDLITIAKGLGGGYQPIGAVVVGERVFDALSDGSGSLKHGLTYMGHPLACAAALAVQLVIREDNLLANVCAQGAHFRSALAQNLQGLDCIGDIRGRGLFVGVELVADRLSKEPFAAELSLHSRIRAEAFAQGLMVYPGGGTVDGRRGDHVLFAPAYTASESEIDEIALRFRSVLDQVLET